jgi:hypothetical protein
MLMMVHKVQQFHQNNFSAPEGGYVGQRKIVQIVLIKN